MIPAAYTKEQLAEKFREAAAKAVRGFGWNYALRHFCGVDEAAIDWFQTVFAGVSPYVIDSTYPVWDSPKDRATALCLAAYLIELDEEFD